MNALTKFYRDEEGAAAVEYGLLVALIAVAIIIAITAVGDNLGNVFNYIATKLVNGS